jgi:peptidoglycan/LPS O-acetylase OafA/YrhL
MRVVQFIGNRLARLYPLHIYTLITFSVAFLVINLELPTYRDGSFFTLLQQITFTQNIGLNPNGPTWNTVSWSISVEVWINVIFIVFMTRRTKSIVLFLFSILGLAVIYINTGHLDTHATNYYYVFNSGMIRGGVSFFLGIISYRGYLRYKNNPRLSNLVNYMELLAVIAVFLLLFAIVEKYSRLDMAAPFIFMFIVAIFSFEQGHLSKFLRRYHVLGDISYSVYLNQVTLLMIYEYTLPKLGRPLWTISIIHIVTLLVYSRFTYNYLEKPLNRISKRMISQFPRIT